MVTIRWSRRQVKIIAAIILPVVLVGWLYAGHLIFTYSRLRTDTVRELHDIAATTIVEVAYIPNVPPPRATECFSMRSDEELARFSSRLAAADDKGVPGHARLLAEFDLFIVTAVAGRVRYEGRIYRELPEDVFLRSGAAVDRARESSTYAGYPARIPGLSRMLLDNVEKNGCPRI